VSASTFIARHSIFTQIAKDRPNTNDFLEISLFAKQSKEMIETLEDFSKLQQIPVKGNMPYKVFNQLPIYPRSDGKCVACGNCASKCPVGAISIENPRDTNVSKCLACGRCIVECPLGARDFRGDFFEARAAKFQEAFSSPRKTELFYAEVIK
jgi:ferredoxin